MLRPLPRATGPGTRLRHPVSEDRGDPSERLEEELPLLRVLRDELDLRVRLLCKSAHLLDDVPLLDDRVRPAALRARGERRLVRDGLLFLVAAGPASDGETELPEPLRDEEGVDSTEGEGVADLLLAVHCATAALLPDFLHEALNEGRLPPQGDAPQEGLFRFFFF